MQGTFVVRKEEYFRMITGESEYTTNFQISYLAYHAKVQNLLVPIADFNCEHKGLNL